MKLPAVQPDETLTTCLYGGAICQAVLFRGRLRPSSAPAGWPGKNFYISSKAWLARRAHWTCRAGKAPEKPPSRHPGVNVSLAALIGERRHPHEALGRQGLRLPGTAARRLAKNSLPNCLRPSVTLPCVRQQACLGPGSNQAGGRAGGRKSGAPILAGYRAWAIWQWQPDQSAPRSCRYATRKINMHEANVGSIVTSITEKNRWSILPLRDLRTVVGPR